MGFIIYSISSNLTFTSNFILFTEIFICGTESASGRFIVVLARSVTYRNYLLVTFYSSITLTLSNLEIFPTFNGLSVSGLVLSVDPAPFFLASLYKFSSLFLMTVVFFLLLVYFILFLVVWLTSKSCGALA